MSGSKISNPPLEPPEAGPGSKGARDFLGSPCPRGPPLGGFLGGFDNLEDPIDSEDFDEFLDVIYDVSDSSEDFEQLVEHYDNQHW
jgi:hypothetical protein